MCVCIMVCEVRREPRKDILNEPIKKWGIWERRPLMKQSTDTPVTNKTCLGDGTASLEGGLRESNAAIHVQKRPEGE
jgi:hypothetical protein